MVHIKTGGLKRSIVICIKIKGPELICCYLRKILIYTWSKRFLCEYTLVVFMCLCVHVY
jgi:hypothetical protein